MEPLIEQFQHLIEIVDALSDLTGINARVATKTCNNVIANKEASTLNTASIESFERTIADMQAQIDELIAAKE